MDYGCIYLQVNGDGNIVTCHRTYAWLTILQWVVMYITEGWCGPSGFPAREEDFLDLVSRGENVYMGEILSK